MAVVRRLPIHHYSAGCIFWSFGIIEFIVSHLKIRVPLKPMLGDVAGVEHLKIVPSFISWFQKIDTLTNKISLDNMLYFHN